jgi:hypothetical protein
VRTIIVDSTVARMKRSNVIDNAKHRWNDVVLCLLGKQLICYNFMDEAAHEKRTKTPDNFLVTVFMNG